MRRLVLLRHGESLWNQQNLFTGWTDVDLSPDGRAESVEAAQRLKREGLVFDLAFTSLLKRSIRTLWIVQDRMDLMWLPVLKDWRLNERHYGALQGLNKTETALKYGEAQVKLWRRSFAVRPPPLVDGDPRHPRLDPRYRGIDPKSLPLAESLSDTIDRVLPYWHREIAPALAKELSPLIVAHGNSLRGLIKYLDGIGDDEIAQVEIPTGVPLVYELDAELRPLRHYYLDR